MAADRVEALRNFHDPSIQSLTASYAMALEFQICGVEQKPVGVLALVGALLLARSMLIIQAQPGCGDPACASCQPSDPEDDAFELLAGAFNVAKLMLHQHEGTA